MPGAQSGMDRRQIRFDNCPDVATRPLEGAFGYKGPRKPHALTAYLAHDFANATAWDDLQAVLRAKGYELAARGGGLILQTTEGERLCTVVEIGQPSSCLIKRFGVPFPGHACPRAPATRDNGFCPSDRKPPWKN